MAKRNKKQQRKKANIKKRNISRSLRRVKRDETPYRDDGLSLAQTGLQDMPAILQWSQVLANEPEFHEPIFEAEDCMRAFAEQSAALKLNEDETAMLPPEELSTRKADLVLATVEQVLTKKHQREILRRLKKMLKRYGAEDNPEMGARLNLLISLVEFAKDDRVWGAIGLVSTLVLRQIEGVMSIISTGRNMDLEDDTSSIDARLEKIRSSPEAERMEQFVKQNPGVLKFFAKKLDREWDIGMQAIEEGELQLWLFDEEDYETVNGYLAEAQLQDVDEETYNKSDIEAFGTKIIELVTEKMNDAEFRQRVVTRLTQILDEETVDAQYLSFVLRLRYAFADETWLAESANYIMMRSFFADMRPSDEDIDKDLADAEAGNELPEVSEASNDDGV